MLEIRIDGLRVESHPAENPRYRSRLLLVHGLWGGAAAWRHFASFLAHRGWETLAVDLRARPGSLAADVATLTLEDYRRDLEAVASAALLRSGQASERPIVVGHDLGGLLALDLAAANRCRAAVAIAPTVPAAITPRYRRALRGRWLSQTIAPPPGAEIVLDHDSKRVGRSLLRGEIELRPAVVPTVVVAGDSDPLLDRARLAAAAEGLGCDFVEREAGHWNLQGRGFERHVDLVHRWIVRRLGPELLRLTGYEDLEEDPEG